MVLMFFAIIMIDTHDGKPLVPLIRVLLLYTRSIYLYHVKRIDDR